MFDELPTLFQESKLLLPMLATGALGALVYFGKLALWKLATAIFSYVQCTTTLRNISAEFEDTLQFFNSLPYSWGSSHYEFGYSNNGGDNVVKRNALSISDGTRWFYLKTVGFVRVNYLVSLMEHSNCPDTYSRTLVITTFGSIKRLQRLQDIIYNFVKQHKEKIVIYKSTSYDVSQSVIRPISRNSLVTPLQVQTDVLDAAIKFTQSESIYTQLGIPYKFNIWLHGPPGTGKTSLIKLLASELNADIFIPAGVMLSDQDVHQYLTLISKSTKPIIVAIEDFKLLNKDEATAEEECERRTFLNFLDGLHTPHGLICVLTTNYMKDIPPEFIRPGRFDCVVEIGYIKALEATMLCKKFGKVLTDNDSRCIEALQISASTLQSHLLKNTLEQLISKYHSGVQNHG